MPRPVDTEARIETANAIKAIARQQLADNGTNGISLRGIARELGMTAPAIYNYFPKLDDLITALLVDAFNSSADRIDDAIAQHDTPADQLYAGFIAYREWAIEYPSDFRLIYGNPIPGYEAPRDVTIPLASRPLESFVRCIISAQDSSILTIPDAYQHVPASISHHVHQWLPDRAPELQAIPNYMSIFYMMTVGWSRMHGIIMLEIHQHITPTLGDIETFYSKELEHYLQQIGMTKN